MSAGKETRPAEVSHYYRSLRWLLSTVEVLSKAILGQKEKLSNRFEIFKVQNQYLKTRSYTKILYISSVIAFKAGNSLPSIYSSKAPPAVEM